MIEGQAFPSCNAFARAGQVMPWYCLAPGAARGARGQALRVFEWHRDLRRVRNERETGSHFSDGLECAINRDWKV